MGYGQRLKLLRDEKRLSQEELGKVFHLSQSIIAHYEAGRKQPSLHTLNKLADFFNVSVDYLLDRTDVPNLQEHPTEAYEANWHLPRRMIGPELAYSTGLEAAVKAAGFKFDMEVLEVDNSTPPGDVASILGLAPGKQALKRTRIQNIDGIPSRVITSWMPIDLFIDIVDQRPQGKPLFEMLEEMKGIYPVRVEERIRTSSMTAELANLLKTKQGTCALEMQRVVHSDNGRVLEVAFITAVGRLWELAYKYAAGGRISVPDWSWLRYTPTASESQVGAGWRGDTVR
jgi:transcriptional regulator with XRE-family HTH domain